MAPVAAFAIVVGALDGDLPGDGQPGLGSVVDEASVRGAEGASAAGADGALFLPALMPAWWTREMKSWLMSRRVYSIGPKILSSGRSTNSSASRLRVDSASWRR